MTKKTKSVLETKTQNAVAKAVKSSRDHGKILTDGIAYSLLFAAVHGRTVYMQRLYRQLPTRDAKCFVNFIRNVATSMDATFVSLKDDEWNMTKPTARSRAAREAVEAMGISGLRKFSLENEKEVKPSNWTFASGLQTFIKKTIRESKEAGEWKTKPENLVILNSMLPADDQVTIPKAVAVAADTDAETATAE